MRAAELRAWLSAYAALRVALCLGSCLPAATEAPLGTWLLVSLEASFAGAVEPSAPVPEPWAFVDLVPVTRRPPAE